VVLVGDAAHGMSRNLPPFFAISLCGPSDDGASGPPPTPASTHLDAREDHDRPHRPRRPRAARRAARRCQLPPGHAQVLLDADSPYHAAPVAVTFAGVATLLPQLLQAYRTGGGVPYAAYGPQLRCGIAALNRPMFLHELASTWLPAVPEADRRLRSAPRARVLDLGCGLGASSIALARAYPRAQVLGSTWTRRRSPKPELRRRTRASPTASGSWSVTPRRSPPKPPSSSSPSSRRSTTWATQWGRSERPVGCWPTTATSWSPTSGWLRPSPRPAIR
jgi:hypothetical protein